MTSRLRICAPALIFALPAGAARAARDAKSTALFNKAAQSAGFFATSYGYAVLPTIGKGGWVIGAANGPARVHEKGLRIGDSSVTRVSAGFQAGGPA